MDDEEFFYESVDEWLITLVFDIEEFYEQKASIAFWLYVEDYVCYLESEMFNENTAYF
jgi:hypothetical protein